MPADDEVVTFKQLKILYKRLDSRIDEAFDTISQKENTQAEFWDEHENKLERLRRRINRLERRIQELEGE